MGIILQLLGAVCYIGSLVCWLIILIAAFKDEIWKGIVCLLCGLYMLYYMIFEFEHENKWLIVLGSLLGAGLGAGLFLLGSGGPAK